MENKIKNRLFRFLFMLLMLPFLQKNLDIISGKKLNGDFTNAGDISFSWENWWNGSYQPGKNNYFNDQAGFRPDLVRINNQVDYWLFKKLHSNSVVMGTNHCLYQKDYIN